MPAAIYRVWCATESKFVFTPSYAEEPPTTCPNDPSHEIDGDMVVLVAYEPVEETISKAAAEVTAATQAAIQESVAATTSAIEGVQAQLEGRIEDTRVVLVNLPIAENTVKKQLVRVASFLWSPKAKPLQTVFVRGAVTKGSTEQLIIYIYDVDKGSVIASVWTQATRASVTYTADVTPKERSESEPPFTVDVIMYCEDTFNVEHLAAAT